MEINQLLSMEIIWNLPSLAVRRPFLTIFRILLQLIFRQLQNVLFVVVVCQHLALGFVQ